MNINAITGLPESGGALLCNLLNQNPAFHAVNSSVLSELVSNIVKAWSHSPKIKAELDADKEATENKLRESIKAFCDTWYLRAEDKSVFDRSSKWAYNVMALREIYSNAKVIVTIRDLRNVFASVEKQLRKNPLLDAAESFNMKTIWARADAIFSPNGIVGSCIDGILDIYRRKLPVYLFKYERFVDQPALVMNELYTYLEIEPIEHDFVNIINTTKEPDAGSIKPLARDEWKNFMNEELAQTITQRFQAYNETFGYR
jgi:hypothetical protein